MTATLGEREQDRKLEALARLERHESEVRDLASQIFDHPELSTHEQQAVRWCRDLLETHGFAISEVAGVPTAFTAELAGDPAGPTVGILAEYDALPEIGHGCGHHLIAGSAVGAGIALAGLADLPGTVKVFGCPAEEIGVGKPAMLDAGVFDGVDVGLTFHAHDTTSVMTSSNGVRQWTFEFHGKASHSATDPWQGINALDGVLMTYQNLNALRQFVRDGVRVHGIVTHGGDAFNVVPEKASCQIAVRSTARDELGRVAGRALDCANAAALATGTRLHVTEGPAMDPVRYNDPLAGALTANLEQLGEQVTDWPALASTDFGNVSCAVPALLFSVATWPEGVAFHTREAAEHAGKTPAFDAMLTGARAMALTAVDLMTDPALLDAVADAFHVPEEG